MQERWKRSGYSKSKVHLSLYNIFLNPQLLWVRFLRLFSDSWSRYFFIFYLTITLARFIVPLLHMFAYDHPGNNQDHSSHIEHNGKPVRQRLDITISKNGASSKKDPNDDQNIHFLPASVFPSSRILNSLILATLLPVKITPRIIIANAIPSPKLPIAS